MVNENEEGGCSTDGKENSSQHSDSIEGIDYISSLPDVILQEILSSFETKFVVTTSVLSKRWKHVWSEVPTLSYEFTRMNAGPIDRTLSRYKAPKIARFTLGADSIDTEPYISRWIRFAKSRNVENLSMRLSFFDFEKYIFPDFFYVNSSLKQLKVEFIFRSSLIPRCTVSWTSLTELYLAKCNLSDESMANIMSGCPMLEILTLSAYADLRHLDLSKSIRLWKLKIDHGGRGETGPLEIVAPHIYYLELISALEPLTLVDVSSLTEADLKLWFIWNGFKPQDINHMMQNMLAELHHVRKLTFEAVFLQVLSLAEFIGFPFLTFKVEALELETKIALSVMPGIAKFLKSSPKLKKLTIHIKECVFLQEENLGAFLVDWQGLDPYQFWDQEWKLNYGDFPTLDKSGLASLMELVVRNTRTLETLIIVLSRGYGNMPSVDELLQLAPTFSHSSVSIVLKQSQVYRSIVV